MAVAEHVITIEEERILRRALWDLVLTPRELLDIVEGRGSRDWPSRGFCVARLLESINWLDLVRIVKPELLCSVWPEARPHVRRPTIREGMDFACRFLSRRSLSAAG
jgi:hypothetical protein